MKVLTHMTIAKACWQASIMPSHRTLGDILVAKGQAAHHCPVLRNPILEWVVSMRGGADSLWETFQTKIVLPRDRKRMMKTWKHRTAATVYKVRNVCARVLKKNVPLFVTNSLSLLQCILISL